MSHTTPDTRSPAPQTGGELAAAPGSAWSRGEVPRVFWIMFMVILLVAGANLVLRGWWYGAAGKLDWRLYYVEERLAKIEAAASQSNPERAPTPQDQSQSTPTKTPLSFVGWLAVQEKVLACLPSAISTSFRFPPVGSVQSDFFLNFIATIGASVFSASSCPSSAVRSP